MNPFARSPEIAAHPRPHARRIIAITFVAIAISATFSVIAAPVSPAHAAQCTIGTGLGPGAAREGISCPDGISGGDSGGNIGSSGTPCLFSLTSANIPEGFLDFTSNDHLDDWSYEAWDSASGVFVVLYRTTFVKNGRVVGEIDYVKQLDGTYTMWLKNTTVKGWATSLTFDCMLSKDGPMLNFYEDKDLPLPLSLPATTGVVTPSPPSPVINEVQLTGMMTPLPHSADQYLLRLNVTNTARTTAGFATVGLDLSSFSIKSFFTLPPGTSCPLVSLYEPCSLTAIPAGATRTIVLLVQARDALDAGATVPVTVSNTGGVKSQIYPGSPNVNRFAIVAKTYVVERPTP